MIEGRKILGSIGLVILVVFVIVAVFAPYIAPYDPHQMYRPLEPPSSRHLLGTDNIGNDILSELIYGTRVSLFIAFVVSTISMLVGTSLGLIAGYFDKVGFLIMRVVDVFLTIPRLPLIIVIASFIHPSVWNLIAIFLIFGWLMTARIIRSEVLTLRRRYYIDATKMIGGSDLYILWRHHPSKCGSAGCRPVHHGGDPCDTCRIGTQFSWTRGPDSKELGCGAP